MFDGIWATVALAASGAVALFAAWYAGRAGERSRQDARRGRDYRDTRKRIDEAINEDFGTDEAREWLRRRSERSGRLRDHGKR